MLELFLELPITQKWDKTEFSRNMVLNTVTL